ncbi:hypothetical protein D3C80_2191000 [compost metagenome]
MAVMDISLTKQRQLSFFIRQLVNPDMYSMQHVFELLLLELNLGYIVDGSQPERFLDIIEILMQC